MVETDKLTIEEMSERKSLDKKTRTEVLTLDTQINALKNVIGRLRNKYHKKESKNTKKEGRILHHAVLLNAVPRLLKS
jgi:hypothetical protein